MQYNWALEVIQSNVNPTAGIPSAPLLKIAYYSLRQHYVFLKLIMEVEINFLTKSSEKQRIKT